MTNEEQPVEPVAPESIRAHARDYRPGEPWREYTMGELGAWVHLLSRRAEHRADQEKAHKDLTDARNYLAMMSARLDALAAQLGVEAEPAP